MIEPTRVWARGHLTGNALAGVLTALNHIPNHMAPRVQLDSQSPWANVDAVPGPRLAVWLATGAVYNVDDDGAVGDDPIQTVTSDDPNRKTAKENVEVLARALAVAAQALEEVGQPSAARSASTVLASIQS